LEKLHKTLIGDVFESIDELSRFLRSKGQIQGRYTVRV